MAAGGNDEEIQYGNPRWKRSTNNVIDRIVFCQSSGLKICVAVVRFSQESAKN